MAFKKKITLPNGVDTFHHQLEEVHWVRSTGQQVMLITSWINKEALESGCRPADVWQIILNNAFGPELTQGVLDACTIVLQQQPIFADAEIVPDVIYEAPEVPLSQDL